MKSRPDNLRAAREEKRMSKKNKRLPAVLAASIFATAFATLRTVPASGQSSQSGDNAPTAPIGSPKSLDLSEGAEQAVKQAYHGAVDAVKDTGLTTEVKTSLLADKLTQHSTIHVKTRDAIVTLSGGVASLDIARRAQQVAEGVKGVQLVRNELKIATASAASGASADSGTN
jgi:osmotically-inducible protein OsmY